MFKNDRAFGAIVAFILSVSLSASQLAHAATEYNTIEVKTEDYIEKGGVQNAEVILPRNDSLAISDPQGTFIEYLVTNGQTVKKGDPLASYQLPGDKITLDEMKLKLEKDKNTFQRESEKKEADIAENQDKLLAMNSNSIEAQILELNIQKMQIGYEQYVYQTQKALEELNASIQELESAITDLRYIYAPYDGLVYTSDEIKAGEILNPGIPIINIADINSAILAAKVSGVNKLWYGLEVSITGISNRQADTSKVFKGIIAAEDKLLNGKASTGMVYIKILGDDNLLSPGQKANITTDAVIVKNVTVIPSNAVQNDDMDYVYTIDKNNELRKQYISGRDNGASFWVYNGLLEGQQIVIE